MDIDKRCWRVNCSFDYWVFGLSFYADFMSVVCDVGIFPLLRLRSRQAWPRFHGLEARATK